MVSCTSAMFPSLGNDNFFSPPRPFSDRSILSRLTVAFAVWLSPYIRTTCSTWSAHKLWSRLCRASSLFPDYLHEDFEELVTELAAGSQAVGCAHS